MLLSKVHFEWTAVCMLKLRSKTLIGSGVQKEWACGGCKILADKKDKKTFIVHRE